LKKSKYFKQTVLQRAAVGGKRYREFKGMGFGGQAETGERTVGEPERILR